MAGLDPAIGPRLREITGWSPVMTIIGDRVPGGSVQSVPPGADQFTAGPTGSLIATAQAARLWAANRHNRAGSYRDDNRHRNSRAQAPGNINSIACLDDHG